MLVGGLDGWVRGEGGLRLRGGLNVGLAIRRGLVAAVREGWAWAMRRMERKRKRKRRRG